MPGVFEIPVTISKNIKKFDAFLALGCVIKGLSLIHISEPTRLGMISYAVFCLKKKYLIIIANYYEDIAKGLLDSALKLIPKSNFIKIIKVPGVFEIPVTISKNIKKYDAFLALGCVIKGETPHFDFISQASTNAIMDLSIRNQKPIGNGIITCLNMKQAKVRKKKGAEAAKAVISILSQK